MKSLLKVGLIVLLCAVVLGQKKFRRDYKYVSALQGWLKYQEIPANWKDARLRCHMEGATLASPLTAALKSAMLAELAERQLDTIVFTGIHATFSREDYTSVEGVVLSQIPVTWAQDEPDNYIDDENALVMFPDGTMGDARSKKTFSYFCYKKNSTLVVNSCGTTDPEYNLDTRTGQCYKFHRVPRTWSRAYMNCMAEGGYLTIINSETEATVIRELFAKNPSGSMLGNFWKDVAFVGFHDWGEHGDWRTIHGQTLNEAGYSEFSGGEPNNATTGEYCGAVYRNALFDDLWCENHYAFICEKDPASLACEDDDDEDR